MVAEKSLETPEKTPIDVLRGRVQDTRAFWGNSQLTEVYSLVSKHCKKRRLKGVPLKPYIAPKDRVYGDRERDLMHKAIDKLIEARGLCFNGTGYYAKETITSILRDIYRDEEGTKNQRYNQHLMNKVASRVTALLKTEIEERLDKILCNPENAVQDLKSMRNPETFSEFIEAAIDKELASRS